MEDNVKGDMVVNDETSQPPADYPPPYSPAAQYSPATVVHNMPQPAAPCPSEVFEREACLAHCVRFWWCRPIGWMAVAELNRARALYAAGDYDGAEQAAKKANMWSYVGLISGIVLVIGVAVATYFIITTLMNSY
ncbi:uncharacterized protein LOC119725608 [Patiria miniata]|uniref:Uncharacterized protein n=1 Tax=Patiria miniata TaxID=46514 RepID=A0A913ZPM3_PATMI|nr:uncharacterized protein LOC119725608 [Patiria miniata]